MFFSYAVLESEMLGFRQEPKSPKEQASPVEQGSTQRFPLVRIGFIRSLYTAGDFAPAFLAILNISDVYSSNLPSPD